MTGGLRQLALTLAAALIFSLASAMAQQGEEFPRRFAGERDVLRYPDTQLEPLAWSDLGGWATDDHAASFKTFLTSCKPITVRQRRAQVRDVRLVYGALRPICERAMEAGELDGEKAREFYEANFRPIRIQKLGEAAGFLTGYYEPIVDGSRFPMPEFPVPLYRKPPDLVPAARVAASASFPNKGAVVRKNTRGETEAYYTRAEIEDGVFDGQKLEIAYLRDPTDLFFIQIQGSGQVKLEDGTMLRVNYAAHNGWPYLPVGRILIERGIIKREDMSMDAIRKWMAANPDGAKDLRRMNRSYVFFRITGLSSDNEAVGAQGVQLTARRSIAVDRILHVYGTPFYIEAELPIEGDTTKDKFGRLMISQDTGSAIIGPARADIYWGPGTEAGRIAGRLKHPGRFAMLVPKEIDPSLQGRNEPLPLPRPVFEGEVDVSIPLPRPRPGV